MGEKKKLYKILQAIENGEDCGCWLQIANGKEQECASKYYKVGEGDDYNCMYCLRDNLKRKAVK